MAKHMTPIKTLEEAKKEFEKKWGKICSKCNLRKGTILTSGSAEGGKTNICKC